MNDFSKGTNSATRCTADGRRASARSLFLGPMAIVADIWRARVMIGAFVMGAVLVGLIVSLMATPRYVATSWITFAPTMEETADAGATPARLSSVAFFPMTSLARAHMSLIRSREVASRVIDRLHLAAEPEFNETPANRSFVKPLMIAMGLQPDPGHKPLQHRALKNLNHRLMVDTRLAPEKLGVQVWSADPRLSAKIANAIAEETLSVRQNALKATIQRFNRQIAGLRQRLTHVDTSLARHGAPSGLISDDAQTGQQINRITQLATLEREARAHRDLLEISLNRLDAARNQSQRPVLAHLSARAKVAMAPVFPNRPFILITSALAAALLSLFWVAGRGAMHRHAQRVEARVIEAYRAHHQQFDAGPPASTDVPASRQAPQTGVNFNHSATSEIGSYTQEGSKITNAISTPHSGPGDGHTADNNRRPDGEPEPVPEPAEKTPSSNDMKRQKRQARQVFTTNNYCDLHNFIHANASPRFGALSLCVIGTLRALDIAANAAALARFCANAHTRVVLIDANEQSPQMDNLCGHIQAYGLSDLISGKATFVDVIQRDGYSNVHVITFGNRPAPGPLENLDERLHMIMSALANTYDLVIVNLGNCQDTKMFQQLMRLSDATIFVSGQDDDAAVDEAIARLAPYGPPDPITQLSMVNTREHV